jgi:hypothetical protein
MATSWRRGYVLVFVAAVQSSDWGLNLLASQQLEGVLGAVFVLSSVSAWAHAKVRIQASTQAQYIVRLIAAYELCGFKSGPCPDHGPDVAPLSMFLLAVSLNGEDVDPPWVQSINEPNLSSAEGRKAVEASVPADLWHCRSF